MVLSFYYRAIFSYQQTGCFRGQATTLLSYLISASSSSCDCLSLALVDSHIASAVIVCLSELPHSSICCLLLRVQWLQTRTFNRRISCICSSICLPSTISIDPAPYSVLLSIGLSTPPLLEAPEVIQDGVYRPPTQLEPGSHEHDHEPFLLSPRGRDRTPDCERILCTYAAKHVCWAMWVDIVWDSLDCG